MSLIYAVSSAEVFASGAIKVLSGMKNITHLAFGLETKNVQLIEKLAKAKIEYNNQIKEIIKKETKNGVNYNKATIKALKIVDLCIGSLYDEVINKNKGCLIITSDHGNCEAMVDENDNTITYHTMNKVPFILCERKLHLRETEASIQDIAPTILSYLNCFLEEVHQLY